jgi:hypothetical protein
MFNITPAAIAASKESFTRRFTRSSLQTCPSREDLCLDVASLPLQCRLAVYRYALGTGAGCQKVGECGVNAAALKKVQQQRAAACDNAAFWTMRHVLVYHVF